MKKYSFILILIQIFYSCSSVEVKHQFSLKESDQTISLNIGKDVNLYTMNMHHFTNNDDVEFITIENRNYKPNSRAIFFYRLDSCKLYQTVEISNIGPNAIPGFFGHGIINTDSIIISSLSKSLFYLVNANGEILRTYDFDNEDEYENTLSFYSSLIYLPMVINDGKIYGKQLRIPWKGFSDSCLEIAIDTATNSVSKPNSYYPVLHPDDNKMGHNEEFSRIFDGKHFVYSFCVLDSIYVFDGVRMKSYMAKSKYMGDIEDSGYTSNTQDMFAQVNTQARYGSIVYDKNNEVYYRFCHCAEDKNEISNEYLFCHGAFSIMILDKEFNVIGETQFQAGRYAPMLFFMNEEGLWLSENNYERKDRSEDILVFRCLKLIGREQ